MSDADDTLQSLKAFSEASAVLTPLQAALALAGLLRGALTAGLLDATRTPASPAQIAALTGMDEARVADICAALAANGVLVASDGAYALAERWATPLAPDFTFPLRTLLDDAFATAHALQAAGQGAEDYWMLSPADRIALARGVTFDPASPLSPRIFKLLFQELPELDAMLTAGARYLELGCGVGGGLLTTLRLYPNTTAVGVDLAGDLLAAARRQAVALGVDDRVVFWQRDARDVDERDAFDYVFWSQFFFASGSRATALHVALHALKPGGYLIAPLIGDAPPADDDTQVDALRLYALSRVLFGAWGIPILDAAALQREVSEVGFSDVTVLTTPINQCIVARRPHVAAG